MPGCTVQQMVFGRVGRREIEANFGGGALSSDGGVLLVRQVDRKIGLSAVVIAALSDPRAPERITHSLRDLVAQRLYGLCCGYEDLNDHDVLRHDPLMQTAVGKVEDLASSPTFSRLETRVTRADVIALNRVLVEQFILKTSPQRRKDRKGNNSCRRVCNARCCAPFQRHFRVHTLRASFGAHPKGTSFGAHPKGTSFGAQMRFAHPTVLFA